MKTIDLSTNIKETGLSISLTIQKSDVKLAPNMDITILARSRRLFMPSCREGRISVLA